MDLIPIHIVPDQERRRRIMEPALRKNLFGLRICVAIPA